MTFNRFLLATTLLMGLAAAGPSPAQPAVSPSTGSNGNCAPTKVKFIATADERSTAASTAKHITGTKVHFTQGGSSPSCVLVYFSGMASTASTNVFFLSARLDGANNSASPVELFFAGSDPVARAYATTFILEDVAPGSHTVEMYFRSNGNTISVEKTNTIVTYAR